MFTEKMQTERALSESTSSHRYSKWPDSDLPPPDYLDVVDVNGRYSPFPERKYIQQPITYCRRVH
ncbi:Hypothetical predicted protein [Mytilus galloprovincialis]|uniref:Uncharacterized protein n=1 Tax=Mytilus galloprovincialis TaxID=29158 RepID=A0A8B6EVL9_MYTGA|nr:Hypothetical predicted protein [Mytilus galloprovincialis]